MTVPARIVSVKVSRSGLTTARFPGLLADRAFNGGNTPFMDEVMVLKRCAMCPEPVIYTGPDLLRDAKVFCGEVCALLWDLVTPGEWIDACELMPGGRLYDCRDIWTEI